MSGDPHGKLQGVFFETNSAVFSSINREIIRYPDEGSNAETSVYLNRNFVPLRNNFILYHVSCPLTRARACCRDKLMYFPLTFRHHENYGMYSREKYSGDMTSRGILLLDFTSVNIIWAWDITFNEFSFESN